MKNNNKSEYTIKFVDKALTLFSQHTNLNEPESVKHFIAQLKDKNGEDVSNGYKKNLCLTYNKFCKYYKIKWEMPLYEPEAKTIKIPTKEKIEMQKPSQALSSLSIEPNSSKKRLSQF